MTPSEKLGLRMPTAAEDAAIAAGIVADSDTMEITLADVARMQARGRGRSKMAATKVAVTIRLDADVLEKVKSPAQTGSRG